MPVVIALAGDRAALDVGVMGPPPGTYCAIQLDVGVADDDAVGLPTDGAVDMVGKSISLKGTLGCAQFHLESAIEQPVSLAIDTLTLSDKNNTKSVTITVDTSALAAGVDLTNANALTGLLANLNTALRVSLQ